VSVWAVWHVDVCAVWHMGHVGHVVAAVTLSENPTVRADPDPGTRSCFHRVAVTSHDQA
jgi:hypothetical protein